MMKKLPNAPKSPVKFWGIVLGIPCGLLAILIGYILYQGSPDDITRIANQYSPNNDWKLVDEVVRAPANWCVDVECPSVDRRWSSSRDVTKEEFIEELNRSPWRFPVEGSCLPQSNLSGTKYRVCTASGYIDEYKVSLSLAKSISDPNETDMILSINK